MTSFVSSITSLTCPCFLLITVAPFIYWKLDACGILSAALAEWVGWRRTKQQYFRHKAYTERWAQGQPGYGPLAPQLASLYVSTYPETHRLSIEYMLVYPLLAYIAGSVFRDKVIIALICLALYEMSAEPLMRPFTPTGPENSREASSAQTYPLSQSSTFQPFQSQQRQFMTPLQYPLQQQHPQQQQQQQQQVPSQYVPPWSQIAQSTSQQNPSWSQYQSSLSAPFQTLPPPPGSSLSGSGQEPAFQQQPQPAQPQTQQQQPFQSPLPPPAPSSMSDRTWQS